MKAAVKRNIRTYKVADADYQKAQKRGAKEKQPLATIIEQVVIAYGKGHHILYQTLVGNYQQLNNK